MTQAEFDRLVTLDVKRLVAKAQAEYEAQQAQEEAPAETGDANV